MKRLMCLLLVASVAAPFATSEASAGEDCIPVKDGATEAISGVVMENSTSSGGGPSVPPAEKSCLPADHVAPPSLDHR